MGFHLQAVEDAGRPSEQAFAHIGLYLGWLIRHDLIRKRSFRAADIDAVKRGQMTGSDLRGDVDEQLMPDYMSTEGAEFSDARYTAYLEGFDAQFPSVAQYAVADDAFSYAVVEPYLDRLYADWVASGRPPAPESPHMDPPPRTTVQEVLETLSKDWADIEPAHERARLIALLSPDPPVDLGQQRPESDLEALIPADVTKPPLTVDSDNAKDWDSARLNRAIRRLGVQPRDVLISTGIGGGGKKTLCVTLYRVPAVNAERLRDEFADVIGGPIRANWTRRQLGSRVVAWSRGAGEGVPFDTAFWTIDELVVHVAGRPSDIRRVSDRMP